MAVPRIFVSSTCYDLGPIRFDLERMIRDLGYEAVLSEKGTVFFDPTKDVAAAAVDDVRHCHMLVLIIGGRFGSEYADSGKSVTNHEYQRAIDLHIPIFALVLNSVEQELRTYEANLGNDKLDTGLIKFASVDSPRVFDFVRQVRSAAFNNALQPFRDFADIEHYLKSQWASLMHLHLTRNAEEGKVADTLKELRTISEKIEALSRVTATKVDPTGTATVLKLESVRNISEYLHRHGLTDFGVVKERQFISPKKLNEQFDLDLTEGVLDDSTFRADYRALRKLNTEQLEALTNIFDAGKSFSDLEIDDDEESEKE